MGILLLASTTSLAEAGTATLPTAHGGGFTLFLFIAEHQAGKLLPVLLNFPIFGLTRPEIEPESTVFFEKIAEGCR